MTSREEGVSALLLRGNGGSHGGGGGGRLSYGTLAREVMAPHNTSCGKIAKN